MNKTICYDRIGDILEYSLSDFFPFLTAVLYICAEPFRALLRLVLPYSSGREEMIYGIQDLILIVSVVISYLGWRGRVQTKMRVWPIYLIVFAAIGFSYAFHSEYIQWFNHDVYGLGIMFGHMSSAFLALVIMGLFTDVGKLMTVIVWTGRINLLWYIYGYYSYFHRGYWEAYMGNGVLTRVNYGLNYGYQVVFCTILFLILFVYNKKPSDLLCFLVSLALVIVCGSRGPMICIAISVILLFVYKWNNIEKGIVRLVFILVFLIAALTVAVIGIPILVNALMVLLGRANISGRFVDMLLNGTLTEDSGRSQIHSIAYDMIRKGGLFGYGFYGDRYVIGRFWFYGYPHNIFLELLIQFGIFVGGAFIVILVYHLVRMLLRCKDVMWQALIVLFFSSSAKLWLSDSFWYYWPFWGLIGIIGLWNHERKVLITEQ